MTKNHCRGRHVYNSPSEWGRAVSKPPVSNDHSTAFWVVVTFNLFVTLLWTGWVIDAQMKQVADPVRELVVR